MANITSQEIAKKILSDAEENKRFWVNNGPILKNYHELLRALTSMSNESFIHHANEEKNDFSSWIKDVYGDEVLSGQLLQARTKEESAELVKKRIEGSLSASPKKAKKAAKKLQVKPYRKLPKSKPKKASKNAHLKKPKPDAKMEELWLSTNMPVDSSGSQQTRDEQSSEKADSYSASNTIIAFAALFTAVGIIKLAGAAVTGASVAEPNGDGIIPMGIITVIATIILIVLLIKKFKISGQ